MSAEDLTLIAKGISWFLTLAGIALVVWACNR